ncbi:glycosyltransferase [Corynebacterium matruchotii]|jgi:ATP synthase F1, epsilon subunit family protein|uniref:glycosyltransferase n=1 Tax=Corynebacterium matruchotii TaxID=43768 RepID=UPI0028EBF47A|nr:glycosyltransferase [Corynebacterium matruchotii]
MRIAYVSVNPGVSIFGPHGASVHIQEIVREFAAQGHEVTIFTTRRGDLVYERYSLFNTVIAEVNQPGVLEVNSPLLDLQRAHRDGVEYAIWAATVAQEQWQLRIVGDGPQRVPLMNLAQKLRVDADFRGAVSPSEIPGQLRGSAIGVAPYPETASAHHYFSPLQVYEYLAAGLPIVASNIGQIPHAVGDAGVLVPGSNASTLAQALVSQSRGMSGWRRHIGHRGHRGRHMRGTAS